MWLTVDSPLREVQLPSLCVHMCLLLCKSFINDIKENSRVSTFT